MAWVYILFSEKLNKYYVGCTQEGVEQRLWKHNNAVYSEAYTTVADDWEIFMTIATSSFRQAMAIEKHIKGMKSVAYYRNLKRYPEMVDRLLDKYRWST